MANRMEGMLRLMHEAGITHALVQKPQNMRYLTGYTGEGSLLVSNSGPVILTDFRYVEQAGRQAPGVSVVQYSGSGRLNELLPGILRESGARELAVEQDRLTMKEGAQLQEALGDIRLQDLGGIPESLRIVKDEDEIACIREACRISCAAFDHILGFIKPGVSEKEIQLELDYTMLRMGAEATGFNTIVCAGENGSLPHAIPGQRVVKSGEMVTMDFGARYMGYTADMTRTVAVGRLNGELRAIYDTVLQAQLSALDLIGPGVKCSDVDKCARDIIDARYPGAFGHSLGHGIGLNVHEQPGLNTRDARVLVPGHVVTVEPGVYIPGVGGCRIEDSVAITDSGFENLISSPKQLIEL